MATLMFYVSDIEVNNLLAYGSVGEIIVPKFHEWGNNYGNIEIEIEPNSDKTGGEVKILKFDYKNDK